MAMKVCVDCLEEVTDTDLLELGRIRFNEVVCHKDYGARIMRDRVENDFRLDLDPGMKVWADGDETAEGFIESIGVGADPQIQVFWPTIDVRTGHRASKLYTIDSAGRRAWL